MMVSKPLQAFWKTDLEIEGLRLKDANAYYTNHSPETVVVKFLPQGGEF
jgi:hypothetical protein